MTNFRYCVVCYAEDGWTRSVDYAKPREEREKLEAGAKDSGRKEEKEGFLRELENISFGTDGREELL